MTSYKTNQNKSQNLISNQSNIKKDEITKKYQLVKEKKLKSIKLIYQIHGSGPSYLRPFSYMEIEYKLSKTISFDVLI
jgi:hypothetical protein